MKFRTFVIVLVVVLGAAVYIFGVRPGGSPPLS